MSIEAQKAILIEEIVEHLERLTQSLGCINISEDFTDVVARRIEGYDVPGLKRILANVSELGDDLSGFIDFLPKLEGCTIRSRPNGRHSSLGDRDQDIALEAILDDPRNAALLD